MKAVIFDIDNTIYPYYPCDKAGLNAVYKVINEIKELSYNEFSDILSRAKKYVKELNQGKASCHNRLLYFHHLCEELKIYKPSVALGLYDEYWNAYLDNMVPFDRAIEFLWKLNDMGVKIAFCTDLTEHIQTRKLIKLGLDELPAVLITSEECGAEKPESIMFETALKKLGTRPYETLMIGDDYKKDICGALASGIDAVCYGKKRSECRYVLSYHELLDEIERG